MDRPTTLQCWSIADDGMFLTEKIYSWEVFDTQVQHDRIWDAWELWDDVSAFTAVEVHDDVNIARGAAVQNVFTIAGIEVNRYYPISLDNDWTRMGIGDVAVADWETLGTNNYKGIDGRYHELYVNTHALGSNELELGWPASQVLLHEIGHSVLGHDLDPEKLAQVGLTADKEGHFKEGDIEKYGDTTLLATVMGFATSNGTAQKPGDDGRPLPEDDGKWHPSTPMRFDIDYSIALYGETFTTRIDDNTYGFNAKLGNEYRAALDFDFNQRPLITIYDNGGFDTLDASGFRDENGKARPVTIDLHPNGESKLNDGGEQTFAVIYGGLFSPTWIEAAVGGDAGDVINGNQKDNTLYGNGGADNLFGFDGTDHLLGGEDNDKLFGGTEDDFLYGGGGDDELHGESGNDDMYGDGGDDTYFVTETGDRVFEQPDIYGGRDKISTTLNYYDMSTYGKGEWVEELDFTGIGNFIGIGNARDNVLTGGADNDQLYGGEGNDKLFGGTKDDFLYGEGGNDELHGDSGNDQLYGGAGDDVYFLNNVAPSLMGVDRYDTVVEDENGGIDTVNVEAVLSRALGELRVYTTSYTLPDNVENGVITGDRAFSLTGNDLANTLTGNDADNTLTGGGGKDILIGGRGGDWMFGGPGDDIYWVDSPDDLVSETEVIFGGDTGGNDTVYSTLDNYTLPENVENLGLYGGVNGTGNSLENVITGYYLANTLDGGAGDDTLYGEDGNDTLIGGPGADRMDGGAGDDKFIVDNGTDQGGDVVVGGDNQDQIYADPSVAATGLHLMLFQTGTPITAQVSGVANTSAAMGVEAVHGGDGNDLIDASRLVNESISFNKSISFEGLGGNDTFIRGGSLDVFDGGDDTDTIVYSAPSSNYVLEAGNPATHAYVIHDLTTGSYDLIGNVEFAKFGDGKSFDLSTGIWFQDGPVTGQTFDATAFWGGNLAGTAGAGDTASFASSSAGIYVDLATGLAETDDVSKTEYLTSIENVTGSLTGMNSLHGDQNDNILIGGNNFNWFDGRDGNNTLIGGSGIDLADYFGTNGPVTIDLPAGKVYHGNYVDTVTSIEQFRGTTFGDTFTGDAADNYFLGEGGNNKISGGAGNDWLEVYSGNNIMDGGSSNDKLVAGTGNDVLTGGSDADTFVFGAHGAGHTEITDFNAAEGDRIDFSQDALVKQMADVTVTDDGHGNAMLSYSASGATGTVLLDHITSAAVNQNMFVF